MKTQKLIYSGLLISLMFYLGACMYPFNHKIYGNGNLVTQEREIDEVFTKIELEDDYDVFIKEGPNYLVTIKTDENLLDLIQTKVNSGKLKLRTTRGYSLRGSEGVKVYVESPEIDKIVLSGSGYIETDTINSEYVDIDISGSGDIYSSVISNSLDLNISGSGKIDVDVITQSSDINISGSGSIVLRGLSSTSDINISGSGDVRSYALQQNKCDVTISGSGDVYVDVQQYLDVKISGSGNVNYIGYPAVTTNISGSGEVISQN